MSEIEWLALNAFLGFRTYFKDGGDSLERESPGALDDELYYWQSQFVANEKPEAGKELWHEAYRVYRESAAYDMMMDSGALVYPRTKFTHCSFHTRFVCFLIPFVLKPWKCFRMQLRVYAYILAVQIWASCRAIVKILTCHPL
jgi:hypothetical protein